MSQIIRERSVRATKSFTILVSEVPKNRRGRPAENQVEKYVPTFMKEVLAKSFLKDPDNYLAHLKAKERAKERIINNLRPQLPNENNQRGRADKPPGSPRPNVVEGQGSRPRPWPGQELKFDSKFPWNPNTYDDSPRLCCENIHLWLILEHIKYNSNSDKHNLQRVLQMRPYIQLVHA